MTHDAHRDRSSDWQEDRLAASDPLDAILQQADWSQCEPERLARLNLAWDDLVRRHTAVMQRRRRMVWAALVTCASAAAMLIGGWSWFGRTHALPTASRSGTSSPVKTQPPVPELRVPSAATKVVDYRKLYAHAVHVSLTHHLQRVSQQRRHWRTARQELQLAIHRLASCPDAEAEWLVDGITGGATERERLVWSLLPGRSERELVAASRVLAYVASARSLPTLRWLAEQPSTHAIATQCIARLGSQREVFERTTRESDPTLQRELAASLLKRGDPASITLFLRLAGTASTSSAALSAAATAQQAPVDAILDRLQSTRVHERLVAAKVLGVLPLPDVSPRLIKLVANDGCRREVLISLAWRRDPMALQFVQRASGDEWLAASLRAAQRYVQTVP